MRTEIIVGVAYMRIKKQVSEQSKPEIQGRGGIEVTMCRGIEVIDEKSALTPYLARFTVLLLIR